jgi:signal-transduction protein with cAMP-binding, CBS, and nucleotidyltransferase domain
MEVLHTAEDIINEKGSEIFSVTPQTTIFDSLQLMVDRKIGAILVEKNRKYVGIWTERDLMRNIISPGFDPKTAKIGDYMTKNLVSASYDAPIYKLQDMILGKRLRHLLIEREGKYIGVLSIADVIKTCLIERTAQFKELDDLVHLEYYTQWKWEKKRKK